MTLRLLGTYGTAKLEGCYLSLIKFSKNGEKKSYYKTLKVDKI